MTTIYLDYDGVLHHHSVYVLHKTPYLSGAEEGQTLFQYVPLLEQALEPYPHFRIILSTSWVPQLTFNFAKSQLSESLQRRVKGATFHTGMKFDGVTKNTWSSYFSRYAQIRNHVERHGVRHWLAIDDDDFEWPVDKRQHLVCPEDPDLGIALKTTFTDLTEKLAWLDRVSRSSP